jgi:hypothetical protein
MNPQFFEDEKIPMSEMLKHLLMFYKFGGKQLYYFQTNDGQGEIDVEKMSAKKSQLNKPQSATNVDDQDSCDSCVI